MKKNQMMKLMLLNIQGVQKAGKLALLEDYVDGLADKNPHLVALNEHWLCSFEVKQFNIRGYKTIAHFGRINGRGGSLIMVKNNVAFTYKKIKTPSKPKYFESCGCEVKMEQRVLRIITVYRPSNTESNAKTQEFIEIMEDMIIENTAPNRDLIILGDLNINLIQGKQTE